MKYVVLAGILASIGGSAAMGDTIAQRAGRIHHTAIVIDTHSDTTPNFENPEWDFAQRHTEGHIDIPRLREGGYDAVFWAIYMGKTPGDGKAIKTALRRIDSVHEIVRRYPQDLVLATRVRDRKSTRLNSSHIQKSRMPSSA